MSEPARIDQVLQAVTTAEQSIAAAARGVRDLGPALDVISERLVQAELETHRAKAAPSAPRERLHLVETGSQMGRLRELSNSAATSAIEVSEHLAAAGRSVLTARHLMGPPVPARTQATTPSPAGQNSPLWREQVASQRVERAAAVLLTARPLADALVRHLDAICSVVGRGVHVSLQEHERAPELARLAEGARASLTSSVRAEQAHGRLGHALAGHPHEDPARTRMREQSRRNPTPPASSNMGPRR